MALWKTQLNPHSINISKHSMALNLIIYII